MAFYQDTKKKSKGEKRQSAEMRGGFDDEGTRYSGERSTRGRRTGAGPGAGLETGRTGGNRSGAHAPAGRPSGPRSAEPRPEGGRTMGRGPISRNAPVGRTAEPRPYGPRSAESRPEGGRAMGHGPTSRNAPVGRTAEPRPYGRPTAESRSSGRPTSEPRPYSPRTPDARPSGRPARGPGKPADKPSGSYRFSTAAPQRYQERGSQTTPRPYGEQREARQQREDFSPARPARTFRPVGAYRYDTPPAYEAPSTLEAADAVPAENLLSGRNPIREALKSGRDIEKLLVARGQLSGSAREIVQMAKEQHIPVQEVDRARLDAITPGHQGMLAFASAYQYHTVEDMLALAQERQQAPFLVLLDGITDPHNLGAIIRSAECAGAHGVIVQDRRAVGLTPAAVKASAGAVEYLPVARVTNLTQTIARLQKENIWVFAADMEGEDYTTLDLSGPLALVIGAEGEGVGRLVAEACDKRVSLPIRGQIGSLNASVAAGILLYAAMRAR